MNKIFKDRLRYALNRKQSIFFLKKMLWANFGHFLALFGPRNLFLVPGIYFGTYDFGPVRPSVRTSVRPGFIS